MKKILILTLTLLLSLSLLVSCSADEEDDSTHKEGEVVTLNVYNWGEYISDGFEGAIDSNAEFEKYFNTYLSEKYGGIKIEVNYTTYATNEDMYSKLSSGAGTYDVICPSDYMIQRMADEGLLYAFGAENLENYKYIDEDFKGLYYDENNLYSVPYTYGMVGIIYNYTLMNPEDIDENGEMINKSWAMLWDEDYKGKILQFNNPRDAFGSAMYYLGLDINSADEEVWQTALNKLKEQKPLVQGYVNDEIFNKMTTGSATLAPYFAGDFVTMLEDNEYLKFYYPKEGTNMFVDGMCIPKNAENKELAMEYINFMLSEEVAVANALYIGYASPNTLVQNSEEYKEEMGEEVLDILYSDVDVNANYPFDPYYHSFTDTDKYRPDMQAYVNSLWESLKTESAIDLWVHIATAVILLIVIVPAVYSIYIKKKRSRFYRKPAKK